MQALHKLFLFCVLMSLGGNALGSEIINGKKTKQKSRLYMASVQSNHVHICGGFLISEDFVVTAAHCNTSNPTEVVLGTHNLNNVNGKQRYSVKKCIHPSYEDIASGNDIMLLKLAKKARLGKKSQIKPIKLTNKKMKLKEKKKCLVAGWGLTRTGGEVVDDLEEVEVPVINLEQCKKLWKNKLPAKVICAGGYNSENGFCQGDSGGPLVCDQKAVGVVSFNNGSYCDYPDLPNVYTDIFEFLPWIKGILKKKDC
ncbi:granzyme B-like [Notolabrus celidotus]|uniref:granzyme B-like n=1 Tax=Notolabrus celidotus TaxID=1203425 RepID=UPI00148FCCE1|nr:granzyme B-like [Notolabrus celidotus]